MSINDNLKKGTAEMVILHLLTQKERYGYQIAQDLADLSDGKFTLQEGSMYPTLYRLQKNGYVKDNVIISEENQRLRKYYSVTETGCSYLKDLLHEYESVSDGISRIRLKI